MTQLRPTLLLRKLIVFKAKREAFSAEFHKGVNIVRGHNSSGKTTILDFIAYTLGAENIPWKPEALLCDSSLAEIELNSRVATVRRDVNDKLMNPLYIYWGPAEEAVRAPFGSWELYPFKRSKDRLSFTQTLLAAMELPEAQGDGASNLTMHQFLRVMYADQPSLHSPIFRADTFDSALTRETVGNYLCGVYNDSLYKAQLEKRDLDKQIAEAENELRGIFRVLAKSEQSAGLEFVTQQIQNLEEKRGALRLTLEKLRVERVVPQGQRAAVGDEQLRQALDRAKLALSENQDELARAELEIADSAEFVNEIQQRLLALEDSRTARTYFGSLAFTFCPSCLAEIKHDADAGHCSLCKTALSESAADKQILRMRNELQIQMKESLGLISQRKAQMSGLKGKLPGLRQELKQLETTYAASKRVWLSEAEAEIEAVSKNLGAIEQEIKGLYEFRKLSEAIAELQARSRDLQGRAAELDSTIEGLVQAQAQTKKLVAYRISEALGRLLRQDLHRTEEFRTAQHVDFSFIDNRITVEGSAKFSESSTVVLRHLFHIALLTASLDLPEMRFPRFAMLDGIEDGGLEQERAYRLQEIIVGECLTYKHDFQLIFATSQIAPTVDKPEFVVSRAFSEERRSLDIK